MDQELEEVKNDPTQITDPQIMGMYKMVMDHLQPYDF